MQTPTADELYDAAMFLADVHPDAESAATYKKVSRWLEAQSRRATRPTAEKKVYSERKAVRLNGELLGYTDCTAQACIILRQLVASGHGHGEVEGVSDAAGNKPFGFHYFTGPDTEDIRSWVAGGHHRPVTPDEARERLYR